MNGLEVFAGRLMLAWGWKRAVIAILAGALAVLAHPPFDFFFAMFLTFPILVWLLDGASGDPDRGFLRRLWPAFVTGWYFGFGYFLAGLWWLGNALLVEAESFAWAIPLAVLGLPAFLAIFFGLGTAIARILWSDGLGRIAALAFGLALMEWLRGFVLTGFPWNTIGYGAMPLPIAMQTVHILGLNGITALSVFAFSMPALLATRQHMRRGLALAAVLVAAHLGYGAHVLNEATATAAEDAPTIRIVQPSIPQSTKWDEAERDQIFEQHLALTRQAPAEGEPAPSLIVWPETAAPFILTEAPIALEAIAQALQPGQQLATGAIRMETAPGSGVRYYNAISVIGDDGEILASADKVHLVPFGEYLPLTDLLSSLGFSAVAQMPESFTPAPARTLLALPTGTALPLICYEAIFPLELPEGGAAPDFILNVTNDAWYGATPGPYQHFRQAQLRAVELGLPLVRAANNGISAITDSQGRIIEGLGLDAVGVIDAQVPPKTVSNWDNSNRAQNFWLIIVILLLGAATARYGFKCRRID
ncbi:Apolipoprotein N-acyltransferase [Rhizobium sp. EC-SD404]|nr:Apolipoprotein N-acyltransferase [Rhizobium sp. EC-SD404]